MTRLIRTLRKLLHFLEEREHKQWNRATTLITEGEGDQKEKRRILDELEKDAQWTFTTKPIKK